jgi:hypothetical protein
MEIDASMSRSGVMLALAVRAYARFEHESIAFPVILRGIVHHDRVPIGEDHLDLASEVRPLCRDPPSLSASVADPVAVKVALRLYQTFVLVFAAASFPTIFGSCQPA